MSPTKGLEPSQPAIEALPPRETYYEISVLEHRGLVVCVSPRGYKRFVFRHRRGGRLRRIALRATDLSSAVREWAAMRRDTHLGIDVASRRGAQSGEPPVQRRSDRRNPTIARLIDAYLENSSEPCKPSCRSDFHRLMKYVLPVWGDIKARTLRRGDVHSLVCGIARLQPLQANRVLAAIQRLLTFGADIGLLELHPCVLCQVRHCVISKRASYYGVAPSSSECASDCRPAAAGRITAGTGRRSS